MERVFIEANEFLNQKVSYQMNSWASIVKEITINNVLNEIKSDKHQIQISRLRDLKNNNKADYDIHKKNLAGVTFSASFNECRKRSRLKDYNAVLVLDVDKLNADEFHRVKKCFYLEDLVFAFWESPSQEGVKGLVKLTFEFELNELNIDMSHKTAFRKLAQYFDEKYSILLDNSGNDITRLCFMSFDPNLYLKKSILNFSIKKEDIDIPTEKKIRLKQNRLGTRDALFNPKGKNEPIDRYTMQAIIKFLEKRAISITHSYEDWYRVGLAIANSFTQDVGEKYFLKLSSLDKHKFNENNCKVFLENCYESRTGEINFSTIIYLAKKAGYTLKKSERGSEVADENLLQVSSSKTVNRLPEDLKK